MNPFDYRSLADEPAALDLLDAEVRPLAGGTDLVPQLKAGLARPAALVDLKTGDATSGFSDEIAPTADGWRLGALATLRSVQHHEGLGRAAPALARAAAEAATPQLRNRATIAGNLLQRPRCWYYRDPQVSCWLKGGDGCPARQGRNEHHAIFATGGPCVAVHPSDPAVALVALGAALALRRPGGALRTVALAELLQPPSAEHRIEHRLAEDEVVLSVQVPTPEGRRSAYVKAMDRATWAFAIVSVAAVATIDDGGVATDVRVVAGGVANVPHRLTAVEAELEGRSASGVDGAAQRAADGAQPLAHNAAKVPLLVELTRRALAGVFDDR